MIAFLIFILASIGMSHILVDGSIFSSLKTYLAKEGKLKTFRDKILEGLNCYQCTGYWSALIIGFIMWMIGVDPLLLKGWQIIFGLFVYGCVGAFVSPIAAVIIIYLQGNNE